MMLGSCSSRELGLESFFTNPIKNPSKLQTLLPKFSIRVSFLLPTDNNARVFLDFKLHHQQRRRRRKTCIDYHLPSSSPEFESSKKFNENPLPCVSKQNPRPKNPRVYQGFKPHYRDNTVMGSERNFHHLRWKKKNYRDTLFGALCDLESTEDVEEVLNSLVGKLNPKEQTIILKEQRNLMRLIRVFQWLKSQDDYTPNVIHYNVVLRALGKAKKWDELRLCWDEMERVGVRPIDNTYSMLIDVYGKAGLRNEALLWLIHMKRRDVFPDEVTMTTVVRVLRDAEEFDRADKFYKDWRLGRFEIDYLDLELSAAGSSLWCSSITPKEFLTEISNAGRQNPPSEFESPVDMENYIRRPRHTFTYNTLIDLYGKAGRLKDASYAFVEMLKSGAVPDIVTFNTMIFICGTHGHLSEAESFLNKMEESGISPDTWTCTIFLSLYAKRGDIDAALLWYWKIRKAGLFPDKVTNRAILKLLAENNMVEEVETVIDEIEKSGEHIDANSLPDIIQMFIGKELPHKAKLLLEKCQLESSIPSKVYAAILDVYANKGLWNEAELVFFRKQEFTEHSKDVEEYNVMIKAYGMSKLYDRALSLFTSMRSNGTWPDTCTYNSLIQMLSKGDLVDPARELLVEMVGAGFKPLCETFSALIASYTRLGRVSDAVDVYEEMIKVGVEPNETVFGSLVNGFAEAGRIEEVLHYLRIMKELGLSLNQVILTSLVKAYVKVGCWEEPHELFEKIKALEGGPDVVASTMMISFYAKIGAISEAQFIFRMLRESGRANYISFATMMHAYNLTGMGDEAIGVAKEMQNLGMLANCEIYNIVMTIHSLNGQLRECGELLWQMITRKIKPDSCTFKGLFLMLEKAAKRKHPLLNWDYSEEALAQIKSCYERGKPYAEQATIIFVFAAVGLDALAYESCEAILRAEVDLDAYAYNVAMYAYRSAGELEKALNILLKMQDKGLEPDAVTFFHLACCYGKAGMLEGVKRIHSQLRSEEIKPNESMFNAIINAYTNCHRRDLAEVVIKELRFFKEQLSDEEEFLDFDDEVNYYDSETDEEYSGLEV